MSEAQCAVGFRGDQEGLIEDDADRLFADPVGAGALRKVRAALNEDDDWTESHLSPKRSARKERDEQSFHDPTIPRSYGHGQADD